MSIVVRTLSERVFEVVREQILKGRLPNGEPIRQDALANELGVSKIPLREALARLEQEGLLINHPNRGYYVLPMSREQVADGEVGADAVVRTVRWRRRRRSFS